MTVVMAKVWAAAVELMMAEVCWLVYFVRFACG